MKARVASGNSGKPSFMKPYVPILSSTPARITEPAVGASTCASGSHVCSGTIGTLIANENANAASIQDCARNDSGWAPRSVKANDSVPVASDCEYTR